MSSEQIQKMKIKKNLSRMPANKLQDIEDFTEFVLKKSKLDHLKPVKLKGIWKNKGFEKIFDLEKEIKTIRQELGSKILEQDL